MKMNKVIYVGEQEDKKYQYLLDLNKFTKTIKILVVLIDELLEYKKIYSFIRNITFDINWGGVGGLPPTPQLIERIKGI